MLLIGCCVQVMATHLPPEEVEGIRQMFMDLDTDGSGTINFEELREGEVGRGVGSLGAPAAAGQQLGAATRHWRGQLQWVHFAMCPASRSLQLLHSHRRGA
jgi:calcium-dependent protein kinase